MPVKFCDNHCTHDFQDTKYGKHQRIVNERKEGGFRCSVCGKEIGSSEKKKAKSKA